MRLSALENVQTDPPKQRRRTLWAVLTAVLFLAGATGWWYWPRGDARFVGRWLLFSSGSVPDGTIEFYRHEIGRFTASDPSGEASLSFQWHAADQTLVLGPRNERDANPYVESVAEFLMDKLGHSFLPSHTRFQVKIEDADTIQLDDSPKGDSAEPVILRRVRSGKSGSAP